ncbi:MAG TPA: VCBS repeat-containing protein [Planctomycetota bacterium]|nr:VCBS repeat-containing protein [Planctomycetota bacterium]
MRRLLWLVLVGATAHAQDRGTPWVRHTLDDSSRGADGTRLADVNGDGLLDIATGWEEGGTIRAYLNPGPAKSKAKWPAVTVGKVGSPEDAVFADLDGDGAVDVVSCCEGRVRSVFVHWAPKEKGRTLDSAAWATQAVPALEGKQMWMFALPLQLDGRNGIDLVVGAKGGGAQIGWLEAPANPRDLAAWKWHPLREAGWIMSLIAADVDGDGDLDVVASDRKGPRRGAFWLENPGPGPAQAEPWREHAIGASDEEVMFLTLADLDKDGLVDVLAATRGKELVWLRRTAAKPPAWGTVTIPLPPNTGTAKGVGVADIDLDGKLDIVFTCENARGKSGVLWMSRGDAGWDGHEISGPQGTKYDLVELIDLDGDGDLDVLTCEEAENLGVIWYENPTKGRPGPP